MLKTLMTIFPFFLVGPVFAEGSDNKKQTLISTAEARASHGDQPGFESSVDRIKRRHAEVDERNHLEWDSGAPVGPVEDGQFPEPT